MKKIFTFVLIMMSLVYFSNISFAQAQGAAAAGAAGGTATEAGITTGTIIAGAVIAAAAAAAIAASGGGGGTDEIVPTKSAEKQAEENLEKNASKGTQASTSQVALSLNSTESANLATASKDVLGKSYGGVSAATAMTGLTAANLQAALNNPTGNFKTYLDGLNAANPAAYNSFRQMLQSIAARNSQASLDALSALFTQVANDPGGQAAADAVTAVLKDGATNYQAMMTILLTALHPGYTVYFVTFHHGSGVYTTTSHLRK